MLGDFSCKVALQVLGYAWPAYACFKDFQKKDSEKLRLWCIYWMILAAFTTIQPLADTFLFFIPLYYEAKLAFIVYLWYPALSGCQTIFYKYCEPMVQHYEPYVDRCLEDGKKFLGSWATRNAAKLLQWAQMKAFAIINHIQQQQTHNQVQPGDTRYTNGGGTHLKAEPAGEAAPAAESKGLFTSWSSGGGGGGASPPSTRSRRAI